MKKLGSILFALLMACPLLFGKSGPPSHLAPRSAMSNGNIPNGNGLLKALESDPFLRALPELISKIATYGQTGYLETPILVPIRSKYLERFLRDFSEKGIFTKNRFEQEYLGPLKTFLSISQLKNKQELIEQFESFTAHMQSPNHQILLCPQGVILYSPKANALVSAHISEIKPISSRDDLEKFEKGAHHLSTQNEIFGIPFWDIFKFDQWLEGHFDISLNALLKRTPPQNNENPSKQELLGIILAYLNKYHTSSLATPDLWYFEEPVLNVSTQIPETHLHLIFKKTPLPKIKLLAIESVPKEGLKELKIVADDIRNKELFFRNWGSYFEEVSVAQGGRKNVLVVTTKIPFYVGAQTISSGTRLVFGVNKIPGNGKEILQEAIMNTQVDHPRVIRNFGFIGTEDPILVMPFVEGPNLREIYTRWTQMTAHVSNPNEPIDGPYNLEEFLYLCLQCFSALQTLHDSHMQHGDLKFLNVHVNDPRFQNGGFQSEKIKPLRDLVWTLIDFGAVSNAWKGYATSNISFTSGFSAPERFLEKYPLHANGDVYPAGIIFWELMFQSSINNPFPDALKDAYRKIILNDSTASIPDKIGDTSIRGLDALLATQKITYKQMDQVLSDLIEKGIFFTNIASIPGKNGQPVDIQNDLRSLLGKMLTARPDERISSLEVIHQLLLMLENIRNHSPPDKQEQMSKEWGGVLQIREAAQRLLKQNQLLPKGAMNKVESLAFDEFFNRITAKLLNLCFRLTPEDQPSIFEPSQNVDTFLSRLPDLWRKYFQSDLQQWLKNEALESKGNKNSQKIPAPWTPLRFPHPSGISS